MENELYFEVYFLLNQITINMPGVFFYWQYDKDNDLPLRGIL